MTPKPPHKLELYRHAVQHPQAECRLLLRAYRHHRPNRPAPTRLREDFAGSAAVAAHWVAIHESHRALAIEKHSPTCRYALRATARELQSLNAAHRDIDLYLIESDVMDPDLNVSPVDLTIALNFSVLIYHDRDALIRYFKNARKSLRTAGLFIMDIYGGPGASTIGTQSRTAHAPDGSTFTYHWEQRYFDHATARTDCRIHFTLDPKHTKHQFKNAFKYDWRLWTIPELSDAMRTAGFKNVTIWNNLPTPHTSHTPHTHRPSRSPHNDRYRPVTKIANQHDFVAYLVAEK